MMVPNMMPQQAMMPQQMMMPQQTMMPQQIVVPQQNVVPQQMVVPQQNVAPQQIVVPQLNVVPQQTGWSVQPSTTVVAMPVQPVQVAPAVLVLNVPANATVYCANQKTDTSGEQRRFSIPIGVAGRDYYYPIKVEMVQDGKFYVAKSVLKVQSGKTTEVRVIASDVEGSPALVHR